MRLLLLHPPAIANRSCNDCAAFMHEDEPHKGRFGLPQIDRTTGEPYRRPDSSATPCRHCPKIPDGMPKLRANALEMTARNFAAFIHYRECKAVGFFPDDWIVRRNAAIIRAIEDHADRRNRREDFAYALMGTGK